MNKFLFGNCGYSLYAIDNLDSQTQECHQLILLPAHCIASASKVHESMPLPFEPSLEMGNQTCGGTSDIVTSCQSLGSNFYMIVGTSAFVIWPMQTEISRHSKRGETRRSTHQHRHREHTNRSMDASDWLDGVDIRGWIELLPSTKAPQTCVLACGRERVVSDPANRSHCSPKGAQIVVSKGARHMHTVCPQRLSTTKLRRSGRSTSVQITNDGELSIPDRRTLGCRKEHDMLNMKAGHERTTFGE